MRTADRYPESPVNDEVKRQFCINVTITITITIYSYSNLIESSSAA